MISYICAEKIKINHTMAKKLFFIAPIVVTILAIVLTGDYSLVDSFNWWYGTIMPVILTLSCSLFINQESKMKYRAILSLPLSRTKIWYAKVLVLAGYLITACVLLSVIACVGELLLEVIGIKAVVQIPIWNKLFAGIVMGVVSMWQIPLCLFLTDRCKTFGALIINSLANAIAAATVSLTSYWIFIPYSYVARLMCPIIKVLPNGLIAQEGSFTFKEELLSGHVILPGILISLILFVVISFLTGKWFCKKEAI